MPKYAQQPDAIDPAKPILQPLTPERQAEIDALPWIGYLNSPEWKSIRAFMVSAYPASQISGTTEGLEVHHNCWIERGRERPRDLCVLTSMEHRILHNTTESSELIEWLIDHEEDPWWIARLQDYGRFVTADKVPRVRELAAEIGG